MVVGVLVLLGVILLLTMFYTVEADEVAIVRRHAMSLVAIY